MQGMCAVHALCMRCACAGHALWVRCACGVRAVGAQVCMRRARGGGAVCVRRARGVRAVCMRCARGGRGGLRARQPHVVHLEQVGEGRAGRARAAHAWLGLGLGLGLELWGRVRGSGIKDIARTAHGRLHARGPMRIVRAGHPGRDVLDVVVDQIDELREAA